MKNKHISIIALTAALALAVGCASNPLPPLAQVPVRHQLSYTGSYIPVAEADVKPTAQFMKKPRYPAQWSSRNVEGEATIAFILDGNGVPTQVQVIYATDQAFADSGIEAVAQWRFTPAQKSGRVVQVAMQVPIVFNMNESG